MASWKYLRSSKLMKEIDGCKKTDRMELSWSSFSSLAAKPVAVINKTATSEKTIFLDFDFIRSPS